MRPLPVYDHTTWIPYPWGNFESDSTIPLTTLPGEIRIVLSQQEQTTRHSTYQNLSLKETPTTIDTNSCLKKLGRQKSASAESMSAKPHQGCGVALHSVHIRIGGYIDHRILIRLTKL
jgi:hypothetical protein